MQMLSGYVDFHCHLDLYPDFAAAVQAAEQAAVYTLTMTTTPKAWPRNRELTQGTRYVRAALGLHPQLIHERSQELSLWDQYLPETRYIGEVGIDAGPRYYRSLDLQKEIFGHILQECALQGDKILSIHSVRSAKVVLDLIELHFPPSRGKIILHWFSGSISEARRAIDLGCYFSVNSEMLLNERGRSLVASLPADRLLTETDGPFTRVKEQIACPSDIIQTVEMIATLRKSPTADVALDIAQNLTNLLKTDTA
jgi:TatD DNase family protein